MATLQILSPVSLGPSEARALVPPLPSLAGRRLGIRVDRAWRSFHWVADEVAQHARKRLGAADVVLFDPDIRLGAPETETDKIRVFASDVDAALVGLGT
ncbi:MAG TPA: hypothetical protein VNO26_16370 [Candidatus Limnocylindria bacterium]|nr:hypothetical protein [Candidatus Limnocylindria bacterium]